jgi:hypothetical protein
MRTYEDWQAAAEVSRIKMAIEAAPKRRTVPGGQVLNVQLVKPLRSDAFYTYASSPGMRVWNMAVSTADIDTVPRWKPF